MVAAKPGSRLSKIEPRDASSPETLRSERTEVSPIFAINALATVFMTGTALAAALTDSSGFSSVRLWTICGLLFLLLAAATPTRVHIQRHLLSLVAGLSMAVVTVVNLLRWTDASLYPTSGSVDVAWHYAVLQNLFYNGQVPSGMDHPAVSFLHEMALYPFGAHVNAGVVAEALNVQPLMAMTLFVYSIMALSVTLVFELARRAIRETWPRSSEGAAVSAAVTAALAFLAMTRFTEGMVLADYFFAQVVGIYLLLVGALGLQDYFSRGSRVGLGTSAIASVLLVLTYPTYCLIPIGTVALLVLVRHRWHWRKWGAIVPVAAGTIFGLLMFFPGRTWLLTRTSIDYEGGAAGFSLANVGGPLVVALFAVGLAVAVSAWVRRRGVEAGVLVVIVLVATLQLAGMFLLKRTIGIGSYYTVSKLVYVISWLALPLVGVGAFATASALLKKRLLRTRKAGTFMALGLVAVVVAWAVLLVPEVGVLPVVDPDGYVIAQRARTEIDASGQFGMAEGGTGSFLLYLGVMNQPRDTYALSLLTPDIDLVQHWLDSPDKRFLVTTNAPALAQVIAERDLDIVSRQGFAALLAKPT
jgi:hypothetical protein